MGGKEPSSKLIVKPLPQKSSEERGLRQMGNWTNRYLERWKNGQIDIYRNNIWGNQYAEPKGKSL